MQNLKTNYTISISELKKSPAQVINNAKNNVVAILNRNVASAYLVPSEIYEKMVDLLDDYALKQEVAKALEKGEKPIKVSLNEL